MKTEEAIKQMLLDESKRIEAAATDKLLPFAATFSFRSGFMHALRWVLDEERLFIQSGMNTDEKKLITESIIEYNCGCEFRFFSKDIAKALDLCDVHSNELELKRKME